jgi:hypothetical protein
MVLPWRSWTRSMKVGVIRLPPLTIIGIAGRHAVERASRRRRATWRAVGIRLSTTPKRLA